jgi:hypothetical protein
MGNGEEHMRAFLHGAMVFGFVAAGCSDSTPSDPANDQSDQGPGTTDEEDPPTPEEVTRDFDELAQVLSAHARGEFAIMLAAAEISETRMPPGFALTADGAGNGTVGNMSYSFTYFCNNGDTAHTVVPCDGTAHHSHIKLTMTGSQTVDTMSMDKLERSVDWEIRDLTLDKARFRGPDDVVLVTSVSNGAESTAYTLNMDAVYEQVRFMPAATFPTFGTVDFTINAERVRGQDRRVFVTKAHLEYGASGVPTTLTFDGSRSYTVNVKTGAVTKL